MQFLNILSIVLTGFAILCDGAAMQDGVFAEPERTPVLDISDVNKTVEPTVLVPIENATTKGAEEIIFPIFEKIDVVNKSEVAHRETLSKKAKNLIVEFGNKTKTNVDILTSEMFKIIDELDTDINILVGEIKHQKERMEKLEEDFYSTFKNQLTTIPPMLDGDEVEYLKEPHSTASATVINLPLQLAIMVGFQAILLA